MEEESSKLACKENNTILNLENLHETFPKLNSTWEIIKLEFNVKSRRQLKSENNECSAFQEMSIYKNADTKLYDINVSTPVEVIAENVENSNIAFAKDIRYENEIFKDFSMKDEIFKHVVFAEKRFDSIAINNNKYSNHIEISSNLLKLSEKEDNSGNDELSIFCKFMSEQLILINCDYHQRIYPKNSFTMACGLQLHHNSAHRYEMIRKNLPFVLLPDKRTLLDSSNKPAIPADCFFNEDFISPHSKVLQKIADILPKLGGKIRKWRQNLNYFSLIFAMRIDEINIQVKHSFCNQSLFGPSHND